MIVHNPLMKLVLVISGLLAAKALGQARRARVGSYLVPQSIDRR